MLLSYDVSVGTVCPLQHYVYRHIMSDVTKGSPFTLYYVRRFDGIIIYIMTDAT